MKWAARMKNLLNFLPPWESRGEWGVWRYFNINNCYNLQLGALSVLSGLSEHYKHDCSNSDSEFALSAAHAQCGRGSFRQETSQAEAEGEWPFLRLLVKLSGVWRPGPGPGRPQPPSHPQPRPPLAWETLSHSLSLSVSLSLSLLSWAAKTGNRGEGREGWEMATIY